MTNCVRKILQDYLKENGFDGLFYPGECACMSDDLMPCDGTGLECEPGYFCNPKPGSGYDWMIGPKKPKKPITEP